MLQVVSPTFNAHLAALAASPGASMERHLGSAIEVLSRLAASPGLLDTSACPRKPGGFTRNLIHAAEGVSVWALIWSPGSRTPIHDHHCSCCFGVVAGAIRELWFRPVGADQAILTADHLRRGGYVACMVPEGPNVHQMINDGPEEAISVHIYGYDSDAHTSSIDREYRAGIV